MRPLTIRRPRAPKGTRRFTKGLKPARPRRPAGPWSPRQAVYFALLRDFVRRQGHARVPYEFREGTFRVGLWVSRRRRDHRTGALTAEQARALERLPGWSWNPFADDFAERLALLGAFLRREGHVRVPSDHAEQGVSLGHWVEHLRALHRRGKLGDDMVQMLERLPGWTWQPVDDLFAQGLAALRSFARRERHTSVRTGHVEAGIRLHEWVTNRRQQYRNGQLMPDRIRALEAVPHWTWNARDDRFEWGYRRLCGFAKREGHARVPHDHVENAFPLGAWVHKQRTRRATMDRARARRLESVPGWTWSVYDARFATGLAALRSFVRRTGHARVPAAHVEGGVRLGAWVGHLRHRKSELTQERIRTLSSFPGWAWKLRSRRGSAIGRLA
jgi:Helicase associated domain